MIRQHVLVLLLPAWLLAAAAAARGEEPELVTLVLNAMPADAQARCAYTRVSIEDDEQEVERYDPRGSGVAWTLVSLNGEAPSEAALRRYAEREDNRADRNHPMDLDIRDMVETSSWRLASENGHLVEFEFRLRPHGELTERLVEKVIGSFVIDKTAGQAIRLRIENTEAASIAPFVRVTRYVEDIRFMLDPHIGVAVPAERRTERRGRALGLKSLDRIKVFRYEDYACAPP